VLTSPEGKPRGLPSANLGQLIVGRRALRLAVLAACQSAQSSAARLFGGVGPGLVQYGVPAVVAMQYSEVELETAMDFTDGMYGGLVNGKAVDEAVNAGRQAISARKLEQRDWSTPVLYLGTRTGRVLDIGAASGPVDDPWLKLRKAGEELAFARDGLNVLAGRFAELRKRVNELESHVDAASRLRAWSQLTDPVFMYEGPKDTKLTVAGWQVVSANWPAAAGGCSNLLKLSVLRWPHWVPRSGP